MQDKTFLEFKFKQCEDLPVAVSNPQCAVIEDRVYVSGGTLGDEKTDPLTLSQVFEYSLVHKRWASLMPNPARHFALTDFLGRLISVGGVLSLSGDITGNVSVYSFVDQIWKDDRIPPMPTKRFHPTVVVHGRYLAVCGGVTQGGSTTDVVEVLLAGGQWFSGPPLPYRICSCQTCTDRALLLYSWRCFQSKAISTFECFSIYPSRRSCVKHGER